MIKNMIRITLNEALQARGRTVYWLAQNSGVPHVTLWKLSKAKTQNSISLPVMSRICAALECKPADLLEYVPDAEDKAIATLIKAKVAKDGTGKATKRKGARRNEG
jgi:putative transcriptional regulator